MLRKIILPLVAVALVACQKDDGGVPRVDTEEANPNVVASVAIFGEGFETGTGYEPMSRAENPLGSYKRINNVMRYILLRKIDDKWIIEKLSTYNFYPQNSLYMDEYFNPDGQLPDNEFAMELRPGDYRLVALINVSRYTYNQSLYEGMIVRDESAPGSITAPQATGYDRITGIYATRDGQVKLGREIFAGSADFSVEKQQDLHSPVEPVKIDITATRRSSSFKILFKEGNVGGASETINGALAYFTTFIMTAEPGYRFCDGINVFGEPYYDPVQQRTEIDTRITTNAGLITAKNGLRYAMSRADATIYGSHFFTDSLAGDIPYTLSMIEANYRSGDPHYEYQGDIEGMVLRHNTYDAVSLTLTDEHYPLPYPGIYRLVLSTDENGDHEQAAFLFDPDYEWNI